MNVRAARSTDLEPLLALLDEDSIREMAKDYRDHTPYADARDRACARAELTSNAARVDARRFYERLGFVASHVGMKLYLEESG